MQCQHQELWTNSICFKWQVSASSESMYDDAYTIQQVMTEDTQNFNYVAGIVPFLFNLIQDVSLHVNVMF